MLENQPLFLAEIGAAYAPDIAPISALNRLARWIKLNKALNEALQNAGYYSRQHVFTSWQVELIFAHLGGP